MSLAVGLAAALALSAQDVQPVFETTPVPYVASPPPDAGLAACPGGLCQPEALDAFFSGLSATEAGRRARPVHIVQIGDSHTAGDRITGALRARMQARFGAGGRGVLPPGVPYAGYAPYQVQVQASGWSMPLAPLATVGGYPAADMGLAGGRSSGPGVGAALTLTVDPGAEPRWVGLCGRGGPSAGSVSVQGDGGYHVADFRAPEEGPLCRAVPLNGPAAAVTLGGEVAPVDLYDVSLLTGAPGVVVSNLGMVGATLRDLAGRDERVAATELAFWRPSLIVLAFGTNEGFDDGLDPIAYEGLLRGQIARMRRLAPAASLMILGAPDALRRTEAGGCAPDVPRAPPPNLAVVRDVQRRVAADMGVAFWDWRGRMGGECSAERLATRADPFMRGDRVHFTSAGADWIGGVLSDDLMAAYDGWKAGRL